MKNMHRIKITDYDPDLSRQIDFHTKDEALQYLKECSLDELEGQGIDELALRIEDKDAKVKELVSAIRSNDIDILVKSYNRYMSCGIYAEYRLVDTPVEHAITKEYFARNEERLKALNL